MSEAQTTDLFYGHVGDAIYDAERKNWHFTREPRISRELKPLGIPFITVQPSVTHTPSDTVQPLFEVSQNIDGLVKLFPEVVPAASLLPVLARQSEIVDQLTSAHDPTKSDLLAFGKAVDRTERSSGERYIPIAALSGGAAGELVRLVLLTGEDIVLRDEWNGKIRRLTTAGGCQSWWSGNRSPIRQLCFAKTKNTRKQWLGVRYHGATSILCPRLKSTSSSKREAELQVSRRQTSEIDANHITTIPIQRTGGAEHADFFFNPWNSRQVAIVDQAGFWGIWILEKQVHRKELWTVKAGLSGHVSESLEAGPDGGVSRQKDAKPSKRSSKYGWGAILWAGDGNTLVVADRRTLSVYHVSKTIRRLQVPDLSLSESADWILDIRSSPLDDSHIFLTTSSRIFWLRVLPFGKKHDYPDAEPGISILLSWRHFRHRDDISVRMSILKDEGSTIVLLYSRLTALTSVYTFKISDSPPGLPVSVSDPFVLPMSHVIQDGPQLNQSNATTSGGRFLSTLEFTKVKYATVGETKFGEFGFFQLSVLYNDMSLSECLYFGQTTGNGSSMPIPEILIYPAPCKAPTRSLGKGFIVPNKNPLNRFNEPKPKGLSSQDDKYATRVRVSSHPKEDSRTLNFEIIERKIHEHLFESTTYENSTNSSLKPLDQCLELIRSLILNKVHDDSTHQIETLHEILKSDVSLESIHAASDGLHLFFTSITGVSLDAEDNEDPASYGKSQLSRLITPDILAALSTEPQDGPDLPLSQIYNALAKYWIRTLPKRIPDGVRVAMEKLLSKIAAQLYLGNFGVCSISESAEIESKIYLETELDTDRPFSIAIRGQSVPSIRTKLEQGQTERIASTLPSSQISEDTGFLPAVDNFPPWHVPQGQSSLDLARSVSSETDLSEDPASKRLRALTTLTPQPKLPLSSSNILRHWAVGSEPDKYDWEAVQSAIDIGLENPPADADEAETKKMKDKQQARRDKSDNAIARLSSISSLPTRVRVTQSSPTPPPVTQEIVKQLPTIAIPSSQTNMSGSRGPSKKKKAAGFR